MPTQSRADPVPLLLTRPQPQAADFARAVQARFGDLVQIIDTPLLTPRFFSPPLPSMPIAGLILTSQTAVQAYLRLGAAIAGLPKRAFCVGERTAEAARAAGVLPIEVGQDAASLIDLIKAHPPQGPLLHLQGRDTRGNIREKLVLAGIDTVEAIIYAQDQAPISEAAHTVLRQQNAVLIPLFSPRTARIFSAEILRINATSPLFVGAMSESVALELGTLATQIKIADTPDAAAMLGLVAMLLTEILGA